MLSRILKAIKLYNLIEIVHKVLYKVIKEYLYKAIKQKSPSKAAIVQHESELEKLRNNDINLFYYPDYTEANPYQQLLYSHLSDNGISNSALSLEDLLKKMTEDKAVGPHVVFHLHWTDPILSTAKSREEAVLLKNQYLKCLDAYLEKGGKFIWTIHNVLPHDCKYKDVEIELQRGLVKQAHIIHLISKDSIKQINKAYSLSQDKIEVLPHGNYIGVYPNQVTRIDARKRLKISADTKVFLFLGMIRQYKGIHELINSFKKLSEKHDDIRLIIAGKLFPPFNSDDLHRLVSDSPKIYVEDRFILAGELQNFLNACDYVVIPYKKVLTSGSLVLAFSFSRPIIAPAVGSIPEIAENHGNSILYNPNERDSLINALDMAYSLPQKKWERLCSNAYNNARKYDWNEISHHLALVIDTLFKNSYNQGKELINDITTEQQTVKCLIQSGNNPKKDSTRVAIVILNYEYFSDTVHAIKSIERSTFTDYHIYIVDTSSATRSFQSFRNLFPKCTVIQSKRNIGYAGGNNVALQLLQNKSHEYIWILNPDMLVPSQTLSELVTIAETNADLGIIGSKIFRGLSKKEIWFAGGIIEWDNGLETRHLRYGEQDDSKLQEPYSVDYVTGASIFMRKHVLSDVGLFPEEYFLYFEDADWCIQAKQKSIAIKLFPTTYLFHLKRSEENGMPKPHFIYYFIRNRLIMCKKYRPSKLEQTKEKQQLFIDNLLKRIEQNDASYHAIAKRLIDQAIEDGLNDVKGWRDLKSLIE